MKSLQTLDKHDQLHNDIKPENYLVKFKHGSTRDNANQKDLTQIEIALTDFGLAGSNSKGGTPVYASPECLEKTNKKSDVFSFGRVILFLLLRKVQFMQWLFVPIKNQAGIESIFCFKRFNQGRADIETLVRQKSDNTNLKIFCLNNYLEIKIQWSQSFQGAKTTPRKSYNPWEKIRIR